MTREDIRNDLRRLVPECTEDVLSDAALNSMLLVGDKEVAARTKCIVGDYTFTCTAEDQHWDLTAKIANFYAIDDFPGGGVCYDDEPLEMTTMAQLDQEDSNWRTRTSGTPEKYFMRGKELWVDRKIKTADTIQIYYAAISDDFNADDITPFNQLTYLEPFHNSLVLYLVARAKAKSGKVDEAALARNEYLDYVAWMKKEIMGTKKGKINFEPRYI